MAWYDELAGALAYPAHQLVRGAQFMGGLSARDNRELQAQYMAKNLRDSGIPHEIAWPYAHQYATDENVHLSTQQDAATQAMLRLLRPELFHHR